MSDAEHAEKIASLVESSLRELNSAMAKTEALSISIGRRTTQIIRVSMVSLIVLGLIMFYLLYLLTRDMGQIAVNTAAIPAMAGSLTKVGQDMGSLSTDVQRLIDRHALPLMDHVNQQVERVAIQLTPLLGDLRALAAKLGDTAESLQDLLRRENRDRIARTLGAFAKLSDDFVQVSDRIQHASAGLERLTEHADHVLTENRQDVRATVQELRTTMRMIAENVDSVSHRLDSASRNLNEFSRQLRENPAILLGVSRPREPAQR
jgi:methyl-accepting chemotaxis protein